MGDDIARIAADPKPLRHLHTRMDMHRDTTLFVTTNIDGWPHVTIGDQATLIMHPHFAKRLMDALQQVLDGKEFAR